MKDENLGAGGGLDPLPRSVHELEQIDFFTVQ